jgi:hypothetical protein
MANYFIIGGDGKEYGPVTDADVRLWIGEGRLNGESRAKAESDAEFRALAQFPEFATALAPQATPAFSAAAAKAVDFSERDYELDIGGCISRGWELFKENFGVLFAACLILVVMQFATGLVVAPVAKFLMHAPALVQVGFKFLLPVVTALVLGPVAGGVNLVFLKKIRRQETSVGDVFAGFQKAFAQLYLGALAVGLTTGACLLPGNYVWQTRGGPLLEQMQHLQSDPAGLQNLLPQLMSAALSALPVFLVCLLPATFFVVSWMFTLPLIIDKQMNFGTAMKTSWKMVAKHWWQAFGLFVLAGLISGVGVLACCIGVLFTAPIGVATMMFAYETIFGAEKN